MNLNQFVGKPNNDKTKEDITNYIMKECKKIIHDKIKDLQKRQKERNIDHE